MKTTLLVGATAATAMCLLLGVAIDKTPSPVLAQKRALACGRGGPCPNGPAFLEKAHLISPAEMAWSKTIHVENAAAKAPTVMLHQMTVHDMYYEPSGVQQKPRMTNLEAANLAPIPKPYAPKRKTFQNSDGFYMKSSSAKAPTQMLWNAMVDSEESPIMPRAALKVNKQIEEYNNQADSNPAGTDY